DHPPVFPEYFDLVATICSESVIKRCAAYRAAHSRFAILSEKHHQFAVEIEFFRLVGELQTVFFKRPTYALADERGKCTKICSNAGAVERREIRLAIPQANHGPGIPA